MVQIPRTPGQKQVQNSGGCPGACLHLKLIDVLLLELWAEILGNLCFRPLEIQQQQRIVTVSNTCQMFCLTRAFQFDTQMITIKQSTLTLGPKTFYCFSSQVRLGTIYQTI